MKNTNKIPKNPTRYFGEFVKLANGKFKVRKASKITYVNQYKKPWKKCAAREVARDIARCGLVTN